MVLIDLHLCVMSINVFLLYSFFWVTPSVLNLSADVSEHYILHIPKWCKQEEHHL